ncbi:DUF4386 domain-containing protein [Sporosarcina thermotolerans]|uniref:DUF4386 domain-containing protein n=1 Tax=Sporosarcina thermotolerans TaxID=633404 RepID=A0AAW9A4X6_9BACL|nr:DUF4386 domain-containing protein [Sporosarcina thermotolerans]MDW0116177.1 DUF4386 domain-containing protein [Sporosarcina thermotolerans]WHT48153.1 DUF4386 domain-containing protein [Sporosarcina thermotolerans]
MNGLIIGILYIVAAVTSIIAVVFYQPVLSEQWYMAVANGLETKVLIGVLNDILLVSAAVGTAVMLFPYIRRWNEQIALGYLCFRFMEAVIIAIGLVSILGLLHLSMNFERGSLGDGDLHAAGLLLQAFHRWTFMLGPNLMLGLNTLMYSYLLFRTGLVPKKLALFGMVTAVMVFIAGLIDMFGIVEPNSTAKGLIALPVGVYEMSLAVWLIVKGFHMQNLEKLNRGNLVKVRVRG